MTDPIAIVQPSPTEVSGSIVVAAPAELLYDMISDIGRMGEWSPACRTCWWDEESGPSVGSWFTGRNEVEGRDPWETRSKVVAADRGREFAFAVNGNVVRWGYTFEPVDSGTRVTESWTVTPEGVEAFKPYFEDVDAGIALRAGDARAGISHTLAELKAAAEAVAR
jgi:hypothetical protein